MTCGSHYNKLMESIYIYIYVNKQRDKRETDRNGMIKAAKLCRVLLNVKKSAFKGYS